MSHGCYNRPPLLDFNTIPARWPGDEPLHILNRMTRECQYTKDDQYNDQQCTGATRKEPQPLKTGPLQNSLSTQK